MVDRIGPVNAVAGAPNFDARWERQLRGVHQAMGSAARPLGGVTGVRPGTPTTTVTATSTQWTCQAFAGYADVESAAEAGGYPFSFDAVATGSMLPADGSNQRIDIVYVQIDDPAEGDSSSVPAVTRKYKAGVAGSGVAPSPDVARAFVIAQINVPKAGTGSPSVTWVAPYTAAAGGSVPFVTVDRLKLWTTAPLGQQANVFADPNASLNGDYVWNGANWGPGAVFKRKYIIALPDGSYANLQQIGATLSLPAMPFPYRAFIDVVGIIGFSGSTNGDYGLNVVTTGGTMTNTQGNTQTQCATVAKWYPYSNSAYLDVPANTAATVGISMSTPSTAGHFKGKADVVIAGPGEY